MKKQFLEEEIQWVLNIKKNHTQPPSYLRKANKNSNEIEVFTHQIGQGQRV